LSSLKANHPSADSILGQYLTFLKTTQGLADATLVLRRLHVKPFLLSLETTRGITNLRELAPSTIHDYIIATSKPLTRASRKHLVSGLRSFLRFAHAKGLIERPLVDAVPVILTRKLDRQLSTNRHVDWERFQDQNRTALANDRDDSTRPSQTTRC
jgi:site-specific recombinase XerD